jgi:glucose-6-phosphate 1-epimerase
MDASTHITGLNKRFGIEGAAQVVAGQGGLPVVRIETVAVKAEVSLYGAQVLSWAPANHNEVLFLSNKSHWEQGKAIRGGIPVCFPWFGDKSDDRNAPKHGYARTREWRLDSMAALDDGSVTLVCVFENDAAGKALFPHAFVVAYRITAGARLRLEFTVINTDSKPMRFEEALHTYFRVGEAEQASVRGLEGLTYRDKTDGFREKQQDSEITFGEEVDRVFLNTSAPVEVEDEAQGRLLRTEKQNSESTIVWNPAAKVAARLADFGYDEWHEMVCVEGANVGGAAVLLDPGEEHTMRITLSVAKCSEGKADTER